MIKIKKPASAPSKLLKEGVEAVKALSLLFEANPDAYRQGLKKFSFKKSIYGHPSVKKALIAAQHGKCCFCERKTEMGDVEHYRGKGGYQQSESEKLQFPGYYWLAYLWANLLFCCETCNRRFKRNFFPLENPTLRATSHLADISLEIPLIIHPANEDPEQFIEFLGYNPKAINGNLKGLETIRRTGLDRPFIDDRRRDRYIIFKKIYQAALQPALPETDRAKLLSLIDEAAKAESEFAGMIRHAIKNGFCY